VIGVLEFSKGVVVRRMLFTPVEKH
jgi:hypothetical protein